MSNQSFSNRIMDPEERSKAARGLSEYERRNRRPLIVGALLGLLLGLFIAWVVWPIQWTNAWPPDLSEEAQADYIAAVADAFVASRSDDAAELAYQRLSSFGDAMQAELAAAALYFENHPSSDSALRINNIQDLAVAIQPEPTPAPTTEVPATAYPATADEPAAEPIDSVTPSDSTDSSNWLQTALWLLAAFVLIVGGIMVLRAVTRTQPAPASVNDDDYEDDDEIDEFDEFDQAEFDRDESDIDIGDPAGPEATSTSEEKSAGKPAAASTERATVDWRERAEVDAEALAAAALTAQVIADNPSISVRSGTAGAALDSAFLDDQEDYGFGPETDLPTGGGSSTTVVVDVEPEPAFAASESEEASASGAEDAAIEATAAAVAGANLLTPGRELGRYTAIYYPMSDEYEEAFRIEDSAGGAYVGDCGMGVNMKHGFVQHNPEQVAALDVWLVDLVEEANMSFHSQTLVSQYGATHMPDEKERDDAGSDRQSATLTSPARGRPFPDCREAPIGGL